MTEERCKDILCILGYIESAVRVIDDELNNNVSPPKDVFESLKIQMSLIKHCINDINREIEKELES